MQSPGNKENEQVEDQKANFLAVESNRKGVLADVEMGVRGQII